MSKGIFMNKFAMAFCVTALCSFFSDPIATAHAAKHHRHSHRHALHHADNWQGLASWYGHHFHGRRTANGEHYDMYAMTAAHNSLPLSSYAAVTNLHNNRSIVVRINDRGPYTGNRIMDLSYAAARQLGISGTAAIKITPIAMN